MGVNGGVMVRGSVCLCVCVFVCSQILFDKYTYIKHTYAQIYACVRLDVRAYACTGICVCTYTFCLFLFTPY